MKAPHIGALLLATAGLLACGGGGEELETHATALGTGEFEAASAEEVLALKGLYASARTEETGGIASAGAAGSEAQAATQEDGRAYALSYQSRPSKLARWVWTGDSSNQYGVGVTAAGAIALDAWSQPMLRYRLDGGTGRLFYASVSNGDAAVASCEKNLEECRLGTIRLLENLDKNLRAAVAGGTCPSGATGATVYNNYSTTGRRLMATHSAAVRIVAHTATGIAIYTGANWVFDWTDTWDRTKLTQGLRQYVIYLTGAYLTAHIGQELRGLPGHGYITLQNTALRAQRAALTGAGAVAAACATATNWWSASGNTNTDGVDIEMGVVTP